MKALNNFLSQLTPLLFYSFGGVLIIQGDLSLGALVAVLAAYNRFTTPWKVLLKYYQRLADSSIKYEVLSEQFQPPDMLDPARQRFRPETIARWVEPLTVQNVSLTDEDGIKSLENISFTAEPGSRVAIVADAGARDKIAHLITGLIRPTRGRISVGDQNLSTMPEAVVGSRIGYAGPDSYIFDGSIAENILYGVMNRPKADEALVREHEVDVREAEESGNSTDLIDADWVDYETLGISSRADLDQWLLKVIYGLEINEALCNRALTMNLDPERYPEIADGVKRAREHIAGLLMDSPELSDLLHLFDFEKFNSNATVGANIIFGEPIDESFSTGRLGENAYACRILDQCGLTRAFQEKGLRVAGTMVEMFSDLSPDNRLFEEFSFVDEGRAPAVEGADHPGGA